VTLANIDFRKPENGTIDFEEYEFGHDATFVTSIFGEGPFIWHASSLDSNEPERVTLSFAGAEFGENADFSGAAFGGGASFRGTRFSSNAIFSGARFWSGPLFDDCKFGAGVNFYGALLENAEFSNSTFEMETPHRRGGGSTFTAASFTGAVFGDGRGGFGVRFRSATFEGDVHFRALSEDEWRKYRLYLIDDHLLMKSWSEERKQHFLTIPEHFPSLASMRNANFSGAKFGGTVDFSGRHFAGRVDFTNARFDQPPIFDQCEGVDNLDFYGARIRFAGATKSFQLWRWQIPELPTIGWTTDSRIALRLRSLRQLANRTNNHDLERDLYIEERKAERGILLARYWARGWANRIRPQFLGHCFWILIQAFYWALADYGRSIFRPIIALTLSIPLFLFCYSSLLNPPSQPTARTEFKQALWTFTVANAFPVVGGGFVDREVKSTLFCTNIGGPSCTPLPSRLFQLLAIGQSVFSGLCIFLFALALRNFFKLR
jgi:uncharacterized protein YjbI with pentapeptide repeats